MSLSDKIDQTNGMRMIAAGPISAYRAGNLAYQIVMLEKWNNDQTTVKEYVVTAKIYMEDGRYCYHQGDYFRTDGTDPLASYPKPDGSFDQRAIAWAKAYTAFLKRCSSHMIGSYPATNEEIKHAALVLRRG